MNLMDKWTLLSIFTILVVLSSLYYFNIVFKDNENEGILLNVYSGSGKLVDESNAINKNPNIIYNESSWFEDIEDSAWISDGFYINITFHNRRGIALLHPIDNYTGRYIEQEVFLEPDKNYELNVSIANVADIIMYDPEKSDVGMIVKIVGEKEKILYDDIIREDDKWVDLSFDISEFAGSTVKIRIESYAGGSDGWSGEWASVDYAIVKELNVE